MGWNSGCAALVTTSPNWGARLASAASSMLASTSGRISPGGMPPDQRLPLASVSRLGRSTSSLVARYHTKL